MTKRISILAGALTLLVPPLTSFAFAQAVKPVAAVQFVTEQPASEWLARVYLGAKVLNAAGETVGDINDLVFSRTGQISTVVLGVGGFLGVGERNVGVPFDALTYKSDKDGARIIVVALSKDALKLAPPFKAIEKTTLDKIEDKAVQLKDQAGKKINDMTKSGPVKQ